MRTIKALGSVAVLALAVVVGMLVSISTSTAQTAAPAKADTHAIAVITPTKGNSISGTIFFDAVPEGVHIHGTVSGLAPNTKHGFHIHEFGDMTSPDGTTAGGHYNPTMQPHGGPGMGPHQLGDLGNVAADDKGNATYDMVIPNISIEGTNPIAGRSVVVHAGEDDMTPKANPGARIGMGVIGIAKPAA